MEQVIKGNLRDAIPVGATYKHEAGHTIWERIPDEHGPHCISAKCVFAPNGVYHKVGTVSSTGNFVPDVVLVSLPEPLKAPILQCEMLDSLRQSHPFVPTEHMGCATCKSSAFELKQAKRNRIRAGVVVEDHSWANQNESVVVGYSAKHKDYPDTCVLLGNREEAIERFLDKVGR